MSYVKQSQFLKWPFYATLAMAAHFAAATGLSEQPHAGQTQKALLKISFTSKMTSALAQHQAIDQRAQAEKHARKTITNSSAVNSNAKIKQQREYPRRDAPNYPRRALELGQEGRVMVIAEIMSDGKPRQIKLHASSGYRLLDEAAMNAVKGWVFETNHHAQWIKVPVLFVIE